MTNEPSKKIIEITGDDYYQQLIEKDTGDKERLEGEDLVGKIISVKIKKEWQTAFVIKYVPPEDPAINVPKHIVCFLHDDSTKSLKLSSLQDWKIIARRTVPQCAQSYVFTRAEMHVEKSKPNVPIMDVRRHTFFLTRYLGPSEKQAEIKRYSCLFFANGMSEDRIQETIMIEHRFNAAYLK